MKNPEEKYLCMRKRKAFLQSLLYYVCHVFPINKTKIVMWTFEGSGGYACSPKYIAQEILQRNKSCTKKYKIYWLVKDLNKDFPSEIIKVKDTLLNRAFHLSTAKVWVSNTRSFLGTVKRKKTIYFQTWHGSISLKPIGKYRGNAFSKIGYLVSEKDSLLIDYALSGSAWCTNMWRDGLIYYGNILQTGSPRCDVLFNSVDKCHQKLRIEYNLPQDAKICLYAPTFRGGSQSTNRSVNTEPVTLNFEKLICALNKRFGGTWYVFLRLHPQLAAFMDKLPIKEESSNLIDVSKRDDMAEIMAATDCIITGYSTVIFEGFLTGQAGFIYADDFNAYVKDRGNLMFNLDEIPFSVAQNNDELYANILNFDEKSYKEKSKSFIKQCGITEDGFVSLHINNENI